MHTTMQVISFLSTFFVFVVGVGVLALFAIFVLDRLQTHDAVLRNYPVVGHLRYILSGLGEFFRQYFFAMDRDELPFNRAERNWVDRAAAGANSTIAFGSTRYIREVGTPIFVNCPYPTLETDIERTPDYVIGLEFAIGGILKRADLKQVVFRWRARFGRLLDLLLGHGFLGAGQDLIEFEARFLDLLRGLFVRLDDRLARLDRRFSGGLAVVRNGIGVLFMYHATPTAMHSPRIRPMNIPSRVPPLLFFFAAALGLLSLAIYAHYKMREPGGNGSHSLPLILP